MGSPLLNGEEFQLIWNETRQVVRDPSIPRGGYQPIPPFEIPFLLDSPLVAASAISTTSRPTWKVGAKMRPKFFFESGSAGTGFDPYGFEFSIPLNLDKPFIYRVTRWKPEYQLLVSIPPWLQDVHLTVWQYTGELSDSTENLLIERSDVIRVDLARIEAKINTLL